MPFCLVYNNKPTTYTSQMVFATDIFGVQIKGLVQFHSQGMLQFQHSQWAPGKHYPAKYESCKGTFMLPLTIDPLHD